MVRRTPDRLEALIEPWQLRSTPANLQFEVRPPGGKPWILDLRPLAEGDESKDLPAFPKLAMEIAVTIYEAVADKAELSGSVFQDALRSYWRFLWELNEAKTGPPLSLSEIDGTTGQLYKIWLLRTRGLKESTASTYYNRVRRILSLARKATGEPKWNLEWPSLRREYAPAHRDVDPNTFKPLYSTLKAVHADALRRHSEAMAEMGAETLRSRELRRVWTLLQEFFVDAASVDSDESLLMKLKQAAPSLPIKQLSGAALFVPTWREMSAAYYLVMMHTGWNPETVENIDISADSEWVDYRLAPADDPHATSVAIYGFKNKVGREQIAFSLTKPQAHPYQVIRAQIARTDILRQHLRHRLNRLKALEQPALEQERAMADLERMINSPWLYLKRSWSPVSGYIGRLEKSSLQNTILLDFGRAAVRRLAARGASDADLERHKPLETLRPSDLRDGFANHIFEEGRYNLLLLQRALNHRRLSSTQAYIRQRRQLAQRMSEFGEFQEAVFAELQGNGIDPTFILLRLRTDALTDEQRDRVLRHRARTRMATGCIDPFNPPREISEEPGICQVQRCTICRHAVVFRDSLPGLAGRQAELQHIRGQTPFERFEGSTFELEWEALKELRLKLGTDDAALFDEALAVHTAAIGSGAAYVFNQMPSRPIR